MCRVAFAHYASRLTQRFDVSSNNRVLHYSFCNPTNSLATDKRFGCLALPYRTALAGDSDERTDDTWVPFRSALWWRTLYRTTTVAGP